MRVSSATGNYSSLQRLPGSVPKLPPFHENYLMEHARTLKAALAGSPMKFAYLGGVQSLASAREAMAEGFDAIVMARALIHDPALIGKCAMSPW